MRFNSKELETIAKDNTGVTKEGLLFMKDKEGFLRGGREVYVERWFRLKGNLLFYFKPQTSVPLGAVVLERQVVTKDHDGERSYAFCIKFDGDETYYLAAKSEDEMLNWMDSLRRGSIERMKRKVEEIRQQIIQLTGEDPLQQTMFARPVDVVDYHDDYPLTPVLKQEDSPLFVMSFACSGLQSQSNSLPNAVVEVSTVMPPSTEWTKYARTEIFEQSKDPFFFTTIALSWGFSVTEVTRLKFTVYDVRDIVVQKEENMTVSMIGHAVTTINDILQADQNLHLTLKSLDSDTLCVGVITVAGNMEDGSASEQKDDMPLENPIQRRNSQASQYEGSTVQRIFRFPTVLGPRIKVVETMVESTLSFSMPLQLLKLFIAEERQKIMEFLNLGDLSVDWEDLRHDVLALHYHVHRSYSENYKELKELEGSCFKKSADKCEEKLRMVATNLHVQKLKVTDGSGKVPHSFPETLYDVTTFGAPAAHWMKFRQGGGLRKYLSELQEAQSQTGANGQWAGKARVSLQVKESTIMHLAKQIKQAAEKNTRNILTRATEKIDSEVKELLKFCKSGFMTDALMALDRARYRDFDEQDSDRSDGGKQSCASESQLQQELYAVVSKSMMVVKAKVAALVTNRHGPLDESWFDVLKLGLQDLMRSTAALIKRLNLGLIFILMQQEHCHKELLTTIYIRRDAVFSQALTGLTCGFISKLFLNIRNEKYLHQITAIGFLAMFESLLSAKGDENGMLEDMSVGIRDLNRVKFKIVLADKDSPVPQISGTRAGITVTVPLPEEYFKLLPQDLQGGRLIQTVPILFTLGINEMATFAEMFGLTALEKKINCENRDILSLYYEGFRGLYPHEVESGPQPLSTLMRNLDSNIVTEKGKNIDILSISEEIGWKMNAARFTSCKSAKDRTAMAVTAEQCLILQREHKMDGNVFQQALNALRSEGSRRQNTYKNTGSRLYAFSFLQRKALPKLYQPPPGTYGKDVQT